MKENKRESKDREDERTGSVDTSNKSAIKMWNSSMETVSNR